MFLRFVVCGALLAVSLWCWRSGEDVPSSRGIVEDSAPGRSQWGQGDAAENFSLGLVRTRSLLETRRYLLPPFFASLSSREAVVDDPFADEAVSGSGHLAEASPRMDAEGILVSKGIKFEMGARATFDRETMTLEVTNRPAELEVVEQFVANLIDEGVPDQIKVVIKSVEVNPQNLEELGFDWVLDEIREGGFQAKARRRGVP